MKLKILSFSFVRGGAAKAAKRFSELLPEECSKEMISVEEYPSIKKQYFHFIKRLISFFFVFLYQKKMGFKCSANFFSFKPALNAIENSFCKDEVFHIHWINNDMLSVYDLAKIPNFSVVTLHDEWFYCGIEHFFNFSKCFENSPYCSSTQISRKSFSNYLCYHIWKMKFHAFENRQDLIVTCPSNWLAQRARNSQVLKNCDIRVLFNPIDVKKFSPLASHVLKQKRSSLSFEGRYLVLFGAVGGTKNKLKGFAELREALYILRGNNELKNRIVLGIVGGARSGISELYGFTVREFGYVSDESELAIIYSLAHVTVIPSKVESFGQMAAESLACETPVVAFDTSGLRDIVIPGKTGLLAEPFSAVSLAQKIEEIIKMKSSSYIEMCKLARKHVVENFSTHVVAQQYSAILNEQFFKKQMG